MREFFLVAAVCGPSLIGLAPASAREPHVVRITMTGDADGRLAKLILDGETITRSKDGKRTRLDVLHSRIRAIVEDSMGRRKEKDFEAELRYEVDALKFEHVVAVISAISGYKSGDKLVKLIDKIKFVPPSGRSNGDAAPR